MSLREVEGHLEVSRGQEILARHLLCPPGTHQTLTVAAHHEGIPFLPAGATGKAKIVIEATSPQVEVRSLLAYEAAAGEEQ